MIRREIIITSRFEGFHSWPNAPLEVAFLRYLHRHSFLVRVGLTVSHNDREREFFIEQRQLNRCLEELAKQNKSCEEYAETIFDWLNARWVEVWEDGENGARLERE